jgi:hypothetical protein
MIAGGMESMTNAPYLLKKGRGGYRMGHDKIFDHMMLDGLEDAYEAGRSMGTFGETAPPNTSSRAKRRTRLPLPACSAPRPPRKAVPSTPKSRPSPSRPARAT